MNLEKQLLLASYLLSDEDIFLRTHSIVKPEFFDNEAKRVVEFTKTYFDNYKSLPTSSQISAETGVSLTPRQLVKGECEYASDEIEKFCRNKSLEHAIFKGPQLIADGNYALLEKLVKDSIAISLNKDLGTDYFANPEERLRLMINNQNMLSTGWSEVDDLLAGGINRKEMTMFMANSGVGKSVIMSNLAVNLTFLKYNVLYITLELSEEVVAKRFDSMYTGVRQGEIFAKIAKVASEVQKISYDVGKLVIKRMPESSTTSNDIRAYLKEFELIHGYIPDAIVVDYLDLMASNHNISAENLFVKDKFVAEELRSIGNDFNCVIITASQMGRCLSTDTLVELESGVKIQIKNINIGDNIKTANGFNTVLGKTEIQKQKTYRIKTKFGKELIVSGNHVVPTNRGEWSINSGLSVNDKIMST
jgi:archaellum biogenesis ATPase FlaH